MNAVSVQLEADFHGEKMLLTGDADFAAFDDKIKKIEGGLWCKINIEYHIIVMFHYN